MEQMLRLLHDCGLPVDDVDYINSDGKTMNKLLVEVSFKLDFSGPLIYEYKNWQMSIIDFRPNTSRPIKTDYHVMRNQP